MGRIDQFRITDGPSSESPRILIVRLSSIGDVVLNTAVPEVLRRFYPKAYIAWAVEQRSSDVLIGNPYLDEVIIWPRLRSFRQLRAFSSDATRMLRHVRELRSRRFDIAIDLQGLGRSAMVGALSGAPIRIGFNDAREGSPLTYTEKVPPKRHFSRPGEYYAWALSALGISPKDFRLHVEIPPKSHAFVRELLNSHGIQPDEPYICVCPSTTWIQKHWIEERWSEVIDRLHDLHGIRCVIMGGPTDAPMAERIAEKTHSNPVIAAAKMGLKESGALLAGAAVVASVDTGLLFITLSQNTPAVALYGPTISYYLDDEPLATVIKHEFPCSPCRRKHWSCADFDCMAAITVDEVVEAVDSRLRSSHQ